MRDELIQSLRDVIGQQKWSIFISSHDIAEVELLADWIGILDQGRLCLSEPLTGLLARFRRVEISLLTPFDLKSHPTRDELLYEVRRSIREMDRSPLYQHRGYYEAGSDPLPG